MRYHRSDYYLMRGSGIGSVFSNIFTGLIPLASKLGKAAMRLITHPNSVALGKKLGKSVASAAKRTAVDAGLEMANAALRGENVGKAARTSLGPKKIGKKLANNLAKEYIDKMKQGRGSKKKKIKMSHNKRGRRGRKPKRSHGIIKKKKTARRGRKAKRGKKIGRKISPLNSWI